MEDSPPTSSGKLLGFVLFFVVITALPPQRIFWDGIGFLEWARSPVQLDYGHLLYIPLLHAWHGVMSFLVASEEFSAKLLSALGAAACFLLLWTRVERKGLAPATAITVALVATTTPFLWRQATIIEPTTLTLAALLATASAAERYGSVRTPARAVTLCGAYTVLLGLHLVSIFALPWIVALARGPAPRPPARHLLVPAGFALAFLALAAGAGALPELGTFSAYWRGFLPDASAASLARHLDMAARVLSRGYPAVTWLGLGALVWYAAATRRVPRAALLAAPYLFAFVLLGKPIVGLLVPVSIGLALILADGLRALPDGRAARAVGGLLLPLALAILIKTKQGACNTNRVIIG